MVILAENLPVHSSQQSLGWGLLCDDMRLWVALVAVVACGSVVAVALGC